MTEPNETPNAEADETTEAVVTGGNDTIEHTNGGQTTRSDATDLGVPMKEADDPAAERVGPEDAMGSEPTRGDYSDRLVAGPSVRMEPIADADRDNRKLGKKASGAIEPGPNVRPVAQAGAPAQAGADD